MLKLIGINIDKYGNENIENTIFHKFNLNFSTILIFLFASVFIISLVALLTILRFEYLIIPAILGIIAIPLFFIYPKFWIYTVTLSTFVFFGESADGLSIFDVVVGIFFIGGLAVWFFTEVVVNKRKIIENRWEFVYLMFYILFPLTYIGTQDNDLTFLDWSRGYILYSTMLYYYPMKKILTQKEDWYIFAHIFVFVTFLSGVKQIYYYYTNIISDLKYAYQIGTSIRTNQLLYSSVLSFLFLIYFQIKSRFKQVILFGMVSIIVIALVTSFSRIFWTTTGICIFISFIQYKLSDKIKFFVIILAAGAVLFLAINLFLKDNMTIGLQFLNNRISSSKSGTKDPSANARFVEWEKVILKIKESPIVGQGINKKFHHNSPLEHNSIIHNTIHNGYLHMLYFFGIPLGLTFILLVLYKVYQTIFLILKVKDKEIKYILISILYFFLIFFVVSFFTSEFHKRDDVFILPLVFALIYFTSKYEEPKLIKT